MNRMNRINNKRIGIFHKVQKRSRAQAALEFMMTYGWMLLVLAASIGGLVYFMPSSRSLTTNRCAFEPGISCLGTTFTSDNLTIVVRNSMGQTLYNLSANVSMPVNMACNVSNNMPASDTRITIVCQNTGMMNLSRDSRISILVKYKKIRDGYDQSMIGDIYAKYK